MSNLYFDVPSFSMPITLDKVEGFFESFLNTLWNFLPKLILAIVIFLLGWWLSKLLCKLIKKAFVKSKADDTAVSFIYSFSLCAMRIFIIITAIAQLGVNITALLTAVGAATVTIGLALQDTMKNIASGVMIIINKPFRAGDYVEFEQLEGTVQKILITSTYLLTIDNREVIIPNSRLTNNNIINYTAQALRCLDLRYKIGYKDDISQVRKILNDIIDSDKRFLKTPKPTIAVTEHGDNAVVILARIWCNTEDYWDLFYYIQEEVKLRFDDEKINIPYNQVDIHIKDDKKSGG